MQVTVYHIFCSVQRKKQTEHRLLLPVYFAIWSSHKITPYTTLAEMP